MALFPTHIRNPQMDKSISGSFFGGQFRAWADSLDLGRHVAHQARHTMATNLLRAGATLAHVRRFLGHVSDRMAEHYINSRELHQPGEKPQVSRSRDHRNSVPLVLMPAL
jgi:integrase